MRHTAFTTVLAASLCALSAGAQAAAAATAAPSGPRQEPTVLRKCSASQVEKPAYVTLGKSTVVMLPYSVVRMAVGGAQPGQRAAVPQPAPQALPDDVLAEGRAIPIARVQAMHEGKRRARARRQ